MKTVFVYQILDSLSDSVIATFIGPNQIYAERQFKNFLTDPKIKTNIDPCDFVLVEASEAKVFSDFTDFNKDEDPYLFSCKGDDSVFDEVKHEA